VAAASAAPLPAAASGIDPEALARARAIRAEVDARYRLMPGRKLSVTDATTTAVVDSLTLLTDPFAAPRVVPATNGVYFAICSAAATCPYPARSASWPAAAFLPPSGSCVRFAGPTSTGSAGLVRVERAYSRQELRRPRTESGVRAVPLFPSVDRAFRELAVRALPRGRCSPHELVFASIRGTPLHPSNFNRRDWRPALDRAGLAQHGYRFHDLRHTCVSRLIAAGADIKLVQAVAGHANPMITLKRYSHLLDSRVTEAADRFDPARTA
jgi:hypothetical protein